MLESQRAIEEYFRFLNFPVQIFFRWEDDIDEFGKQTGKYVIWITDIKKSKGVKNLQEYSKLLNDANLMAIAAIKQICLYYSDKPEALNAFRMEILNKIDTVLDSYEIDKEKVLRNTSFFLFYLNVYDDSTDRIQTTPISFKDINEKPYYEPVRILIHKICNFEYEYLKNTLRPSFINYIEKYIVDESDKSDLSRYKVKAYTLKQLMLSRNNAGEQITYENKENFSSICGGYQPRTLYNSFLIWVKNYSSISLIDGNRRTDNAKKQALEQALELLKYDECEAARIELQAKYDKFIENYMIKYGNN